MSSIHRVRCENILTLRAVLAFPLPFHASLVLPAMYSATVNRLCTVSRVFKVTTFGLSSHMNDLSAFFE